MKVKRYPSTHADIYMQDTVLASEFDALSTDLDAAIAERDAAFAQVDALRADRMSLTRIWLTTANPMLGNVSPLDLMKMGRGEKLAQFIEAMIEEGSAPATSGDGS